MVGVGAVEEVAGAVVVTEAGAVRAAVLDFVSPMGSAPTAMANEHFQKQKDSGSPISHIQILNRNEWFKSTRNSIFRQ